MTDNILPPGFTLRAATWKDLDAVADLIRAVCEADGDPDDAVPSSELKSEWEANFDLETDVRVVTDPSGKVVGYEEFFCRPGHASYQGDGYVHPQFEDRGIGTALLRALDERARQELPKAEPDLRIFLRNFMTAGDEKARALHEHEGFKAVRYNWSMRITLDGPPPAPAPHPAHAAAVPACMSKRNISVMKRNTGPDASRKKSSAIVSIICGAKNPATLERSHYANQM